MGLDHDKELDHTTIANQKILMSKRLQASEWSDFHFKIILAAVWKAA